jgi:hypothetical protein
VQAERLGPASHVVPRVAGGGVGEQRPEGVDAPLRIRRPLGKQLLAAGAVGRHPGLQADDPERHLVGGQGLDAGCGVEAQRLLKLRAGAGKI